MKRVIVFFFLCHTLLLLSDCFQPIEGTNQWRLVSQVGECLNYYGESTLDLIDTVLCSVGNVISISRDDFVTPYVIVEPGYYKICENINASSTLTIKSDDVIVDLGSYFLDGVSIIIESDYKNITIKNGLIRNVIQAITVNSQSQNIVIKDMVFDTALDGLSPYGIKFFEGCLGITLKNLSFYNAAPQAIILEGSVVNSVMQVIMENIFLISTNQDIAADTSTEASIHLSYCEVTTLRNIIVTDPYNGLNVIVLDKCNGISLTVIDITSNLDATLTATGVYIKDSSNITHDEISVYGEAFGYGFFITTSNSLTLYDNFSYKSCSALNMSADGFFAQNVNNIIYQECESKLCTGVGIYVELSFNLRCSDCTTNNNGNSGLRINISSGCVITSHKTSNNNNHGMFLIGVTSCVITDAIVNFNNLRGLFIESGSRNVKVNSSSFTRNLKEGFFASSSFDMCIEDSVAIGNFGGGFYFDLVDNIVITNCSTENNGDTVSSIGDGFHIKGVNNGNIPGNPQGTVGRSPVTMYACIASSNIVTGFYFTNVGGVLVRDSSSTYNGNCGFHFDSGTWNASAEGCTALSNATAGFLTWDPVAAYQNRFRDCFAGSNGTDYLSNPLGGYDFAMGNTPGLQTTLPIASIYPSSVVGTPDAALFGIVSPMFCVYG